VTGESAQMKPDREAQINNDFDSPHRHVDGPLICVPDHQIVPLGERCRSIRGVVGVTPIESKN
jgi:hypothetical protein